MAPRQKLLDQLFDDPSHPLKAAVAAWLASSRRFAAFVEENHSKVRKKLRSVREPESALDLGLELEAACLLCDERAFSLTYEPQLGGGRGPDFVVRYTSKVEFALEVTRLRSDPVTEEFGQRLATVLGTKLAQLTPLHANVLLVGVSNAAPPADELAAALLSLQRRAEADEPAVIARYGFKDRGDFFRHYHRLNAVVVRGSASGDGTATVSTALNPQARRPLPSGVRSALRRCLEP